MGGERGRRNDAVTGGGCLFPTVRLWLVGPLPGQMSFVGDSFSIAPSADFRIYFGGYMQSCNWHLHDVRV